MLKKPLSELSEHDFRDLQKNRTQEGLTLEFKRDLNLETESQRLEIAKDISAMANAARRSPAVRRL